MKFPSCPCTVARIVIINVPPGCGMSSITKGDFAGGAAKRLVAAMLKYRQMRTITKPLVTTCKSPFELVSQSIADCSLQIEDCKSPIEGSNSIDKSCRDSTQSDSIYNRQSTIFNVLLVFLTVNQTISSNLQFIWFHPIEQRGRANDSHYRECSSPN